MRKRLSGTILIVMILSLCLYPVTQILSIGQEDLSANDASHTVIPMLELLSQSPVYNAAVQVEPCMEIERIWEIEDMRCEAEYPLVTGMRNGNSELGYDEDSQTFFCALDVGEQDMEWPELQLFAHGAENLRICWVDDFVYDPWQDALIRGYRYELIAYTETEYAYFGIVFTGLPIVTIHSKEGTIIDNDYVPTRVSLSAPESSFVETALVHDRGRHDYTGKFGYRMEFHTLSCNGRDKKKQISPMGMEPDTDWLLLPNCNDKLVVTNYLAFDMWKRWNQGTDALMALDCYLVEVFVQNEYMGIYQLTQTPDGAREIAHAGGDVQRDTLMKLTYIPDDKLYIDAMDTCGFNGECHYAANGNEERALKLFENFVLLNRDVEQLTDKDFICLTEQCVDVDDLISYYLFINACGLVYDNTHNNLFVWSSWDGEQYWYRFGVWDMDWGLSLDDYLEDETPASYLETSFTLATRLLDLNALNSREKLWALWNEKKETILTDEALEAWILPVQDLLHRSGAYYRETEKWHGGAEYLDLETKLLFQKAQIDGVERIMKERWPLEMPQ